MISRSACVAAKADSELAAAMLGKRVAGMAKSIAAARKAVFVLVGV
jgi:hypothetical protein